MTVETSHKQDPLILKYGRRVTQIAGDIFRDEKCPKGTTLDSITQELWLGLCSAAQRGVLDPLKSAKEHVRRIYLSSHGAAHVITVPNELLDTLEGPDTDMRAAEEEFNGVPEDSAHLINILLSEVQLAILEARLCGNYDPEHIAGQFGLTMDEVVENERKALDRLRRIGTL